MDFFRVMRTWATLNQLHRHLNESKSESELK